MERLEPLRSSLEIIPAPDVALAPEKEIFRTLSAPVTVQWELTPWCNEKCVHCYNYWRKSSDIPKNPIGEHTTKAYSSAVDEIIRNRVFHATITGGEPLGVLKNALPHLRRLSESGVSLDFNTNLTMFSKETADTLRLIGVRSILTSLMAADPELNDRLAGRRGTFEDVTRGIKLAKQEGFRVSVSMVITKGNLDQIFKTAEYAKRLGVDTFCVTKASIPINAGDFSQLSISKTEFRTMLSELIRVKDELGLEIDTLVAPPLCFLDTDLFMKTFGHKSCSAGRATCTIGFDGAVRPCSQADQSYGLVMDQGGLNKAWLNMKSWRTDKFIPEECDDCRLVNMCRGGCRAEAYAMSGSLEGVNPYATFSKDLPRSTGIPMAGLKSELQYQFDSRLRFRPEEFGGIIYLSPTKWFAVDHALYYFALSVRNQSFSISELASKLDSELEGATRTAELLLQKNIIEGKGVIKDGESN